MLNLKRDLKNIKKRGQGNTKGEICHVWYKSNDTIFLNKTIYEDYSAARICNFNSAIVCLEDLDIRMLYSRNQSGIILTTIRDSKVSNVKIRGAGTTALQIYYAYQCIFDGLIINDFLYNHIGNGNNYGINIYGSIDCEIINSNIKGGRHCIDVSGGYFPSRNIIISNNTVSSYADKAMSTHPACEYVTFTQNHVYGGFTIRGLNTTIENNDIFDFGETPSGNIIYFNRSGGTSDYFNLINNRIIIKGHGGISLTIGSETMNKILIKDNIINTPWYCFIFSGVESVVHGRLKELTIKNNEITLDNSLTSPIYFGSDCDSLEIGNFNYISNNISGRLYSNAEFNTIKKIDNFLYSGNTEQYTNLSNFIDFKTGFKPTQITLYNNYFKLTQSQNVKNYIRGSLIYFTNNFLDGFTFEDSFNLVGDSINTSGTIFINSNSNSLEY